MSWLSRNRRIITMIAISVILTAFVSLAVRWLTAPNAPTDMTPQEQAVAAVDSPNLNAWPDDVPGILPIETIPLTDFLTTLTTPSTAPDSVYIAAEGDVAAYINTADSNITTVTLLTGQAKEVADTAARNNIPTEVIPAADSRPARSAVATNGNATGIAIIVFAMLVFTVAFLGFASATRRRRLRDTDTPGSQTGADSSAVTSRFALRKTKGAVVDIPKTRFTDVAGCDEAVEDLREIVDFLKNRERFTQVGANPPAGAVLVGPPGTGKTLLARAVAGEAGVPFFTVSGSDFVEKYVGIGASRVRSLFKKARNSPDGAIIFIDEVDAVGRARGGHNSHPEQENTLNALLVEMDGFHDSNVIVLAATNRHDMLDKALTRPGRLDREVHVPLPDRVGREHILAVHATGKPLADDVDLTLVARRTPGLSGAELARIVNEACLAAVRDERDTVTSNDFDHAIATASMGRARTSANVTDHDREITAWHEAGHTVAAMLLPDADPPVSVSIIPRGPAGGVTWMAQGDDQFLRRKAAHARLVVALAGRAAEELLLDGEYTSGAHGDLTSASRLAFAMVTQYGMTDHGLMVRDEGVLQAATGSTDAAVQKVEQLLHDARDEARQLLTTHATLVRTIAEQLLDRDTLNLDDLTSIETQYRAAP